MNTSHSLPRKAQLQEVTEGKVRCLLCERRCLIVEGGKGWCQTRFNQNAVLYTSIYGVISSLSANLIEKKPLYHFYPGSRALTAGSWSCNFGCPWCQNWDISKTPPPKQSRFMSPGTFIQETIRQSCQGTSISFNEPTLSFEWSLDVFQLAREQDLYNTFVTNGYMTAKALDMLFKAGLDAMNIDIKGKSTAVRKYCRGVDVDQVWARCKQAKELGLHLEITTLIIPNVNDDDGSLDEIASHIVELLGDDTPWHVSGYHPAYRFTTPSTPISTLERAWAIGKKAGLKFVYVGNVPGHTKDHTYCPRCNELLIERLGLLVKRNLVKSGRCYACGEILPGAGWNWDR
ncbi:MAG TPA: AmmeMemoRadiSam system radical SAM enzyme [Anaerolineae bacterium]|nr:AmmeMemoRadiSam system radical SAM enzyme [Anaerolineae bacterium]